jgi:Uma2 family endonuclease
MSERALTRMSTEEFLDWGLHQEPRHQLVDGVPVALAGTKQQHDQIVANTHGTLYNLMRGKAMRGKKWRHFTVELGVRIPAGNIRCPDAGVDRGVFDSAAMTAGAPYLVLEVLSPSVRDFDMFGKLEEYKTIPTLSHIVIVDPDAPQVYHWSRCLDEVWHYALLEGVHAVIQLPEVDGVIDLGSLYEGLTFRAQPRLVHNGVHSG